MYQIRGWSEVRHGQKFGYAPALVEVGKPVKKHFYAAEVTVHPAKGGARTPNDQKWAN